VGSSVRTRIVLERREASEVEKSHLHYHYFNEFANKMLMEKQQILNAHPKVPDRGKGPKPLYEGEKLKISTTAQFIYRTRKERTGPLENAKRHRKK